LIGRAAGYTTTIFRFLAVTLVALLVIGRRRIPELLRRWSELAAHDGTFRWALVGHVVAAACFSILCPYVLRPSDTSISEWLISVWALTGGLALAFWLAALAPVRFWVELWGSRNSLAVAASLLIGVFVNVVSGWARALWIPLSALTFAVTKLLLSLISNDVVFDPVVNTLSMGTFKFQIAPVCSGHEGIGMVTASLAVFLVLFRHKLRFPQAFLLLPIGILIIWICNAIRITALILIGKYVSQDVARAGFHSQTGWIMFAAITIAIGFIALRSPRFTKLETEPSTVVD
jgi:exosortase E/protease (VPEID-CTERM system)